jgi:thiol-disulfide isomerase/thioredoxin
MVLSTIKDLSSSGINIVKNNWYYILIIIIIIVIVISTFVYYYNYTINLRNHMNENLEETSDYSGSYPKSAELLFFYANWCPHCKNAKPEVDKIKDAYQDKTINGYKIIFTYVDCSKDNANSEKLMNQYKVDGFPTIKLLKDGNVYDFDAKPTQDSLNQFLNTILK